MTRQAVAPVISCSKDWTKNGLLSCIYQASSMSVAAKVADNLVLGSASHNNPPHVPRPRPLSSLLLARTCMSSHSYFEANVPGLPSPSSPPPDEPTPTAPTSSLAPSAKKDGNNTMSTSSSSKNEESRDVAGLLATDRVGATKTQRGQLQQSQQVAEWPKFVGERWVTG